MEETSLKLFVSKIYKLIAFGKFCSALKMSKLFIVLKPYLLIVTSNCKRLNLIIDFNFGNLFSRNALNIWKNCKKKIALVLLKTL
jgi:hypothetical protein